MHIVAEALLLGRPFDLKHQWMVRFRRMTMMFVFVAVVALAALAVSIVVGGLGQADQIASVIGVLVGLAGVGLSAIKAEPKHPDVADVGELRRVAVASTGSGVLYLFAATRQGSVVRRTFREGTGRWSDPIDTGFPGNGARDVAAVATGRDRIECYVVDRDGLLWSIVVEGDQVRVWIRLDPSRHSGPVVAVDAMSGWSGHRELYAVSHDGTLRHRWKWDGQPWTVWHPAHRDNCQDVALSVPAKDQMECFVLDRVGNVHHRWYLDKHWSNWHTLGNPGDGFCGAALSAVNGSDRHQEVFLVGTAGELAHRWHWQGEKWDQWYPMEHPEELVDISVGATSTDRMECLAVGASGMLWQRSYNPSDRWSVWRQVRTD